LSSRLLPANVKIKKFITVILPVGVYGYETWFLTLREEYRLRIREKKSAEENILTNEG
jgi:hypothetical protein